MTFPITYDEEPLRDMHDRLVDEVLPLLSVPRGRKLPETTVAAYMNELSVIFSVAAIQAALFFKHKAYCNEREFRFFQLREAGQPVENLRYRGARDARIRYTEFAWRGVPAALREIIVGPAAEPKSAERFARDCLRAYHSAGEVEIRRSNIPYRASSS